jgi:hypothetical protein
VLRQLRLLAEHEVDDANAGVHGVLMRTSQLLELAASHARGVGATVRAEALRLAQRRFEAAAAARGTRPRHVGGGDGWQLREHSRADERGRPRRAAAQAGSGLSGR